MAKNLFIAGLSYDTTSDSLNQHFAQVGNVMSAQVITDRYTGQSKGFGFVEMTTEEEAKLAIDKLNNSSLDNRNIVVKEARPREERSNNGPRNSFGRRDNKSNNRRY